MKNRGLQAPPELLNAISDVGGSAARVPTGQDVHSRDNVPKLPRQVHRPHTQAEKLYIGATGGAQSRVRPAPGVIYERYHIILDFWFFIVML